MRKWKAFNIWSKSWKRPFYELEDLTKEEKDEFLILNIDNTEFLGKEIHIERLDILVSELGKIYLNYWSIKIRLF